jgi:hypothetical protein
MSCCKESNEKSESHECMHDCKHSEEDKAKNALKKLKDIDGGCCM